MILSSLGIIAGKGVIPSTLSNGLVSVYKAESNTNDSLGTYNGTAQGGLTYTTGKSGNGFNFNRTTAYVDMGDVMDVGTSSWTYSMWFNPTEIFFTSVLFSKTIAAGVRGRVFGYIDNYKLTFCFDADATNVIIVETPALTINNTNTWYHAVFMLDRSDKLKVYLNGSVVTLTTINGTNNLTPYSATNYNTNNPFRIGAYTNADNVTPSSFYGGLLDEFNVWNRVLTPTEITELYRCGSGSFYPYVFLPTFDSDACAFIGAASITDTTQQSAINQLVLDLKSANIWTKMKAIYPFVGGTASQHRFNLKDPRTVAGAYYITFGGGGTHSSQGYQPDGTTAYANTNLNPASAISNGASVHFSFYCNTNTFPSANGTVKINGGYQSAPLKIMHLGFWRQSSGQATYLTALGGTTELNVNTSTPTSKGFILLSRTSATSLKLYQDGTLLGTNTTSETNGLPNYNMYLGARNGDNVIDSYNNLPHQFASIGDGLSDSEATAFRTAVLNFNTTLNRQ